MKNKKITNKPKIKKALNLMYEQYGYDLTISLIEKMLSPNAEQKRDMLDYIENLNLEKGEY